jgi:hypothetical protein
VSKAKSIAHDPAAAGADFRGRDISITGFSIRALATSSSVETYANETARSL